jgi:tubulin--tyrosine ligase
MNSCETDTEKSLRTKLETGSDEEEDYEEIDDGEDIIDEELKPPRNIWIIKPGENTNCGVGISVCSSIGEVRSAIASGAVDGHTVIVQRYIDRPLLFNRRKFDIRSFALMTSINGIHKGYYFEDGYIRTSSAEYNLNNLSSKYVHLTNDAVQKYSENYGKFESGNKVNLNI